MDTSINFDPVSAVANLGSGLLTQLFYKKNLKRQLNAQKQLMDKQVQSEKDLYDYQMNDQRGWNEYDEQLGKMYDAGINPLASDGSYAGAGSASIGSAGLGSPGSMVSPEFNFVDSILNALKSQEVKIQQKATDKDVQVKDEQIANLKAERDNIMADTDYKKKDTARLDKVMEQINAQIFNDTARVRNEVQQTGLLLLRFKLDKSQFEWQKWNADRNFNQAERGLAIQDYNAKTNRYNVNIAEQTLKFQEKKWNDEYRLQFDKTYSDIMKGNLDSIIKYIDSHRSFGASGHVIYGLAGVMDAFASWLRKSDTKSDFDKQKFCQQKSEELVNMLQNMTIYDGDLEYKPKNTKWQPKSFKNLLSW